MGSETPEIGRSIRTGDFSTNFHDQGEGHPVLLIHGSGPGVTAWANWRLVIPRLAQQFRVLAPDMVGFGYTERPAEIAYTMENWISHAVSFLDALGLERVHLVGNSFGGALSLALAIRYPERIDKLLLMGSAGVHFELTEGLDQTWGYEPSLENMRELLDVFAYDRNLVSDELAQLRYQATLRPGCQEAFASMFPAPRQRWIESLMSEEEAIGKIPHETLIVHGREDRVIPMANALRLFELIHNARLHLFGRCGHWAQIEYADEFCNLARDFFERRAN